MSDAARIERFRAISAEIIALVGAPDGEIQVGLDRITGDIILSPDNLLKLVKRARTTALDEAAGTGGRFGPAPV